MAKSSTKKVAFISSYPPRKCGIATFTSDLIENAGAAGKSEFEPLVVAMRSENALKYEDPVKFEIPTSRFLPLLSAIAVNPPDPCMQAPIVKLATWTASSPM